MDRRVEIFERLLGLTDEQSVHLDANRFVELIEAQQEKDALVSELKNIDRTDCKHGAALKVLLEKIRKSDGALALKVESMMHDLGDKLSKIRDGSKAARAYR